MSMTLQAVMNLENVGMVNGLRGVGSALSSTIGRMAAMAGGALSLGAAMAGLRGAIELGGKLAELSTVTGVAAGDLLVLRQAFEDTGVGAEQAKTAVLFMQKSLSGMNEEGGKTSDTYAALGLNMESLRGMAPTDAMQAIGKAIGGLGSEADKTAALMTIFGRSGATMKGFFADPAAIESAKAALGGLPAIMDRNAKLFDAIGDSLGHIKMKSMGLFAGMAEGLAPALKAIGDGIDGLDLSGVGRKIGDGIMVMVEAFKGGEIGELLGLSLKLGFETAVNWLSSGLLGVGVGFLAVLSNGALWSSIVDVASSAFLGLGAVLLTVFETPIVYLRTSMDKVIGELFEFLGKIPGLGKALGLQDFKAESINTYFDQNQAANRARADLLGQASSDTLAPAWDGLMKELTDTMNTIRATESEGVFDTSAGQAALGEVFDKVLARVNTSRDAMAAATSGAAAGAGGDAKLGQAATVAKGTGGLGDSLSKIGIFVGGVASSSDYAKRTASFTERTARGMEKMLAKIGSPTLRAEYAAAWG